MVCLGPRSEIKPRTAPTVFSQRAALSKNANEWADFYAVTDEALWTVTGTFNITPGAMVAVIAKERM